MSLEGGALPQHRGSGQQEQSLGGGSGGCRQLARLRAEEGRDGLPDPDDRGDPKIYYETYMCPRNTTLRVLRWG